MSELYRILLRKDEAESMSLPRAEMRGRLGAIPGVIARTENDFEFGETDEDGVMELRLCGSEAEELSRIEVEIPRAWVMQNGPRVFALVFMVQGWTGWEVYDPQIEGTLQREAVLQGLVAMRQARMQEEGRRVPEPRLDNSPTAFAPATERTTTDATADDEAAVPKKRRWRFW